ncbi:hypothetical protein PORCAN_1140 [Porphyromonas crevioricanis JCM 13913]|nr:hypothetical protein PORCAN_1140 [Porphyromonas crevioricanis JCM 13913]
MESFCSIRSLKLEGSILKSEILRTKSVNSIFIRRKSFCHSSFYSGEGIRNNQINLFYALLPKY